MSPDGGWVAFMQGANVYVAPLPLGGTGGTVPKLTSDGGDFRSVALSTEGGLDPRWRSATVVDFASGNGFYSYDVVSRQTDTVTVKLTAPRALPSGSIALVGALIITLDRQRVIPSGTIVVRGGRISGGEHLTVQAPFYSDVTTFLGRSTYFYSHTPLLFSFGAWNEEWFWQESP
ncbi:MAG: hypothetical protein ABIW79_03000, partial [Gemmatimonas sp.]